MAKMRYINTKFWNDNWIRHINPLDRYLFLYLLTNEHTNIAGIYELPLETMAFEVGLDEKEIQKSMLPKLKPKVFYIDGWVYIANFQKHQSTASKKVKRGIEIEMEKIPENILKAIKTIANDTLSIPYPYPIIYPNSNPNSNINSKEREGTIVPLSTPSSLFKSFVSDPNEVIVFLIEKGFDEKFARAEVNKFISYWTEPNKSGTKQKWELEKTFELKRRLSKWFENSQKFSYKNNNSDNMPKAIRL